MRNRKNGAAALGCHYYISQIIKTLSPFEANLMVASEQCPSPLMPSLRVFPPFQMRTLTMLLTVMLIAGAAAGSTPATAPASDSAEAAVLVPVYALLKAVNSHDRKKAFDAVRADGRVTHIVEGSDGASTIDHMTWQQLIEEDFKPTPDRWDERMGPVKIEVRGSIATVTTSYQLFINGNIKQCGYGNYVIVRQASAWKVLNMIFTERQAGCDKLS